MIKPNCKRPEVTDIKKLLKTLKLSETGFALLGKTQHCLGVKEIKKN